MADRLYNALEVPEINTSPGPSEPGFVKIFGRNGRVFGIDSSGTEYDLTATGGGGSGPSLYHSSGEVKLRRDEWITGAKIETGYNESDYDERADDNSQPIVSWEHIGLVIPSGRTLGKLYISGRGDDDEPGDLEINVSVKTGNWINGIDSDSEISVTTLYQDAFMNPSGGPAFGGNIGDMHTREILLNYVAPSNLMFLIYIRNVGKCRIRKFYHAWTLEIF